MAKLWIKPIHEKAKEVYRNHKHYNPGDSGLDLYILEDVEITLGETKFIDLGIQCEMIVSNESSLENINISYYLYPRSSIYNTPINCDAK